MTNLYQDESRQEPVAIPRTELSADALRGVIESFVLREQRCLSAKEVVQVVESWI